jgi:uncharacterized protein
MEMKKRWLWYPVVLSTLLTSQAALAEQLSTDKGAAVPVRWQEWSNDIFKKAQAQNKFVLLDLEAIWCHWCHVMDEKTYSQPEVRKLLNDKFICVKVDQDSRPDLSNRYGDYGWPATVVFNSAGKENEIRQC